MRARSAKANRSPAGAGGGVSIQKSQQPQFRINNQIRVPEVRVIMADGTNRGVMSTRDALELARSLHLDLIEVAPTADPPVCRIMDYGRFQYEREKKERAARKSQKLIEVKGVQLRPKTTDHDLSFKIRAARRFLMEGNKVKLTLRMRGREAANLHVAYQMLDKFIASVSDLAVVEVKPNLEGRAMIAVLAPTPATLAASRLKSTRQQVEAERAADKAAGYDEEQEERENADDDEDVEQPAAQPAATVEQPPAAEQTKTSTKEEIAAARKEAKRKKVAQKRAEEQFGLP